MKSEFKNLFPLGIDEISSVELLLMSRNTTSRSFARNTRFQTLRSGNDTFTLIFPKANAAAILALNARMAEMSLTSQRLFVKNLRDPM